MAQLFGISGEQVDRIRPLFPKEQGGKRVDEWMPRPPTKPSTTVAAPGETRMFLI